MNGKRCVYHDGVPGSHVSEVSRKEAWSGIAARPLVRMDAGNEGPVERSKEELQFWFTQELRRRDQHLKKVIAENEALREQDRGRLEANHRGEVDAIVKEHLAAIADYKSKCGALENRANEAFAERDSLANDLSALRLVVKKAEERIAEESPDTARAISEFKTVLAGSAEELTLQHEECKSVEDEVDALRHQVDKVSESLNNSLRVIERQDRDAKKRTEEIDRLQKLVDDAGTEISRRIEIVTTSYQAKIEHEKQLHQQLLELVTIRLKEAAESRDQALQKVESLQEQTKNRHEQDLDRAKQDAQAQISKVNKMLDVLTCDLGLAKSDTAQLESDLKRKEALEHELRKELQEMRHRFEQQKLELTSEIERQKTKIDSQNRRLEHLQGQLGRVGASPKADASAGLEGQTRPAAVPRRGQTLANDKTSSRRASVGTNVKARRASIKVNPK
ncbi:unnamed protein product (mitochondrion) [Plasmodiophora brassicae]|uniref:Uncharacterized protein n=1 Tax=Plasmodiophora brassicae TaxID=37360 RepID=A0A3P3Y0B3_PLABS|nr:unnamed protein product [Plasmodiophora brassicae]